jgi:hypothetical protein
MNGKKFPAELASFELTYGQEQLEAISQIKEDDFFLSTV